MLPRVHEVVTFELTRTQCQTGGSRWAVREPWPKVPLKLAPATLCAPREVIVKSVFVISSYRNLWAEATEVLVGLGASVGDDAIQLSDSDGRLFTLFRAFEGKGEAVSGLVTRCPVAPSTGRRSAPS